MKRSLGLAWLVLVVSCATLPRPGRPAMADVQFRMREFKLANGLRVIVEEDHASPLVGVFTVVGVGSAGDPKDKAGLAHLLEHLAFRARPGGQMTAWNQLEGAGVGFLNAMTSFDDTVYMEVGTRDLLPRLLNIETGRMLDPLNGVDAQTFEVEREVVRNELRQRGENAIGPAFNFLQEAVFPVGHPYARPIGGSHESLSAITFDDAKKFAVTYYRPDNMTLLIIGDVQLETFEETLKQALPSPVFQARAVREPFAPRLAATPVEPPAPPAVKMITRQSTVASPELYVVWSLPRSFDSETVLLDFVNAAANRELSGAFFSDPDIVNVSVFPVPGAEASMLVAQATLRKGDHVERSYERVLDQLVKLWASGEAGNEYSSDDTRAVVAGDRAFGRMRNAALVQMTTDAENIMSRGTERAISAHFTGDPLTYSRRLRALAAIGPGQVSHYAEKYLQRDRARAVLVMPFAATDKNVAAGTTGLAPAGTDVLTTSFPPEKVKALGRAHLERAKNETVVSAKRDAIDETLPNGLRVVVRKRRNSLPVAVVALTFTTGSGGTTPSGAAELASQLASPRGHAYGDGGDFGIEWQRSVSVDRSRIVGTGGSGNVPNMLAQLSERVTSMRVEAASLAFFKSEFADYLEATEKLPVARAERALQAALFKGHPFATQSTMAEQKQLGAAELEGWYDRAWSPGNAVLVVTGDVDAEATLLEVKKWLGPWAPVKNPFPLAPVLTLRSGPMEVLVTNQPGATQAQVHLACLAEGKSLAQELANQSMARLLATALFEKIRGELGASYGFGGGSRPMVGGMSRLDWSGSIENSRLPQAMAVLATAVKQFEQQTLSDRALERARWDVARASTLSGAPAGTVADVLTRQALAGRRTDDVDTALFESLAAIDREQLAAGWRQCAGNLVLSVVGDETRVKEALTQSGF